MAIMSALPELPDASRVAFEAAYRQIHPCPALSQDYKGIYFEFSTELAWQTWQASRKQALEEAEELLWIHHTTLAQSLAIKELLK